MDRPSKKHNSQMDYSILGIVAIVAIVAVTVLIINNNSFLVLDRSKEGDLSGRALNVLGQIFNESFPDAASVGLWSYKCTPLAALPVGAPPCTNYISYLNGAAKLACPLDFKIGRFDVRYRDVSIYKEILADKLPVGMYRITAKIQMSSKGTASASCKLNVGSAQLAVNDVGSGFVDMSKEFSLPEQLARKVYLTAEYGAVCSFDDIKIERIESGPLLTIITPDPNDPVDYMSGLAGVGVKVDGVSKGITDSNGQIILSGVNDGTHSVEISKVGYQTKTISLPSVTKDSTINEKMFSGGMTGCENFNIRVKAVLASLDEEPTISIDDGYNDGLVVARARDTVNPLDYKFTVNTCSGVIHKYTIRSNNHIPGQVQGTFVYGPQNNYASSTRAPDMTPTFVRLYLQQAPVYGQPHAVINGVHVCYICSAYCDQQHPQNICVFKGITQQNQVISFDVYDTAPPSSIKREHTQITASPGDGTTAAGPLFKTKVLSPTKSSDTSISAPGWASVNLVTGTNNTVLIVWAEVPGLTSNDRYVYKRYDNGVYCCQGKRVPPSRAVSGPLPFGKSYYYNITVLTADGRESAPIRTNDVVINSADNPKPAPSSANVTYQPSNAKRVILAWAPVLNATSYIYERYDNGAYCCVVSRDASLPTVIYGDNDLPAATYYYNISAVNAAGTSIGTRTNDIIIS